MDNGFADLQEEAYLLRDQLTEAEQELVELRAQNRELESQLAERCRWCPRPVAKTVSGTLYRHVEGRWVVADEETR